jgi:hypothetical protein
MAKVTIVLSVDWDANWSLDDCCKSAEDDIMGFKKAAASVFGTPVPLTHFICPAFYLRDPSLSEKYTEAITQCLQPEDEVGLHVHCWETLVDAALGSGSYKGRPTAYRDGEPTTAFDGVNDRGQGVPLGRYTTEEVETILTCASKLLGAVSGATSTNQGRISSFRCGAWFTNDHVFEALERCGFTHESSAVPVADLLVYPSLDPMYTILGALWKLEDRLITPAEHKNTKRHAVFPKGIHRSSQPAMIGNLVEVPNNGALADYRTAEEMAAHLREALAAGDRSTTNYVSLGFHYNDQKRYWPRIIEALTAVSKIGGAAIDFAVTSAVRPSTRLGLGD